ncbi:hypothetical protein VB716_01700 [Synechococcus sp. CCY9201]|nr:hypothetical protein [Synechococcus sp. CCY9201]MEA5472936.1 hypothetical protein [Synechococcus sp. CCY9201]
MISHHPGGVDRHWIMDRRTEWIARPAAATALPPASSATLFLNWLSEMVSHALGNPREEDQHLPPAVGMQPYTDRPRKRR